MYQPVRGQQNIVFIVDLESASSNKVVYTDVSCPVKLHKIQFIGGKVSSVIEQHGKSADQGDIFLLKWQCGMHKDTKQTKSPNPSNAYDAVHCGRGDIMAVSEPALFNYFRFHFLIYSICLAYQQINYVMILKLMLWWKKTWYTSELR